MEPKKTHKVANAPSITLRHLADYMSASELARRSIIRSAKYRPLTKLVQHKHAKGAISHAFVTGSGIAPLVARAHKLRNQMADDDFERDVLDHNADYLDHFAKVREKKEIDLPTAEILAPGPSVPLEIAGVRVTTELTFRMRRALSNNKVRLGGAMLRYAKGKALAPEVGRWQSAFLFELIGREPLNDNEEPSKKLCLTIDAWTGECYAAPGDSASRFKNMTAALATIAERWPNVAPPPSAVL